MSQKNADNLGRIAVEEHGQVMAIGIDRPAKLNGFTQKMLGELAQAYQDYEDGPWCCALRCVSNASARGASTAASAIRPT